jgi:flagellar protein FlaG
MVDLPKVDSKVLTTGQFSKLFADVTGETAITHMIFFIAAVVIAMGVVAVLSVNIQSLTGATHSGSKVLSDQIRTDITIINDPEIVPYDSFGKRYTFYAKNTGISELNTEFITVLVDGVLIEPADMQVSIIDGDVLWRPGDVLVVNVTMSSSLSPGDHRVMIAAENGKGSYMSFKTRT